MRGSRWIGRTFVFVTYAVRVSAEQFRQAFNQPEFQEMLRAYAPGAVASPHLFQKLTVPRICLA